MSDAQILGANRRAHQPGNLPKGGWVMAAVGVLICGTAVLAFLTSSSAAPGVLTLLGVFAALGIFFVFGLLAGHIRLTARTESDDVIAAAVDNVDNALVVTARDGTVVFANSAAETTFHWSSNVQSMALERVFAGSTAGNEAYFRLMRALDRGATRREVVSLSDLPIRRGETILRVTVRPLDARYAATALDGGGVWTIEDLTQDRLRERHVREQLENRLAVFQSLPAGLLVAEASGRIVYANPQLCSWLGLDWDPRTRELNLSDLVTTDGVELLTGIAAASDEIDTAPTIDLDLIRDDGTIWPATLLVQPAGPAYGALTALVLDRDTRIAERSSVDEPLATESFAQFFRSAPFGIGVISADRMVHSSNAAFSRLLFDPATNRNRDALTVLGRGLDQSARDAVSQALEDALQGKANIAPMEVSIGEDALNTRRLFFAPLSRSSQAVVYVLDATEQKALEMKFAQSQKMEVVGNLAGGIAHDFNNVMTAIIGFADLLLGTHRPGDPAYQNIKEIRSSADRASDLVHNLLAFSRQQQLQPQVLQLQELVTDVSVMVKRALGEHIELKIHSGRDLWFVKADRGELTRVIMNLAVNARDAMAEGGTLTIRTKNVSERESRRLAKQGMTQGPYVLIEVEDTGVGMSSDVLDKVFEPFFTTKAVGKGTGLGLSTVYGIVKQTGGFVYPEITPGEGTVFRIYLPRVEADTRDVDTDTAQERPQGDLTGTGRVLVVEDEDAVRRFAVEALKRQGYDVASACDGVEALEILEDNGYAVDLIVSDVKMPELDGPALLDRVRKVRPELKFVFVSGYADDGFSSSLESDPHSTFLPKPYSLAKIAATVKERFGG
ncbi:MAG: ATP-binding protein [Pseudomonadota bacterium]